MGQFSLAAQAIAEIVTILEHLRSEIIWLSSCKEDLSANCLVDHVNLKKEISLTAQQV